MNHKLFDIRITFEMCDGMDVKVKEEIRDLLEHIRTKSLDHASNVRTYVTSKDK